MVTVEIYIFGHFVFIFGISHLYLYKNMFFCILGATDFFFLGDSLSVWEKLKIVRFFVGLYFSVKIDFVLCSLNICLIYQLFFTAINSKWLNWECVWTPYTGNTVESRNITVGIGKSCELNYSRLFARRKSLVILWTCHFRVSTRNPGTTLAWRPWWTPQGPPRECPCRASPPWPRGPRARPARPSTPQCQGSPCRRRRQVGNKTRQHFRFREPEVQLC